MFHAKSFPLTHHNCKAVKIKNKTWRSSPYIISYFFCLNFVVFVLTFFCFFVFTKTIKKCLKFSSKLNETVKLFFPPWSWSRKLLLYVYYLCLVFGWIIHNLYHSSPKMLQHDDLPRNSWVYFIIVQYPLMRVKAPDGGADPQPDDVTRPEMVSPLFSSS